MTTVLGEKLSEILENRERSDFEELAEIVLDLENLLFWRQFESDGPQEMPLSIVKAENVSDNSDM